MTFKLHRFDNYKTVNESDDVEVVTVSKYLESRRYNRKLMARLIEKLTDIAKAYRSGKHRDHFPTLTMTIGMSAKYQTLYVALETEDKNYEFFGSLESDVLDAIDEVGFTVTGTDEKNGAYIIEFDDN
jgi:hypothetical protein